MKKREMIARFLEIKMLIDGKIKTKDTFAMIARIAKVTDDVFLSEIKGARV